MSRVGKKPVGVPGGVKVSLSGRCVSVEGPKGSLRFEHRPEVNVAWDEGAKEVSVTLPPERAASRQARALWGTTRAVIQNMVTGVSQGYTKKLEIVGVGWGANLAGRRLDVNVGFAAPVGVPIPAGVNVSVEKQLVTVEGADKQAVGQFAAQVRSVKKPEPYQGKGIKYTDEVIRRKQGKQFGA